MSIFDDTVIRGLMTNAAAVREFPFLRPPSPPAQPGCRNCKQPSRMITSEDVSRIKGIIAGLPQPQQQRLLALAGLDQAVLVYRDNNGTHRKTLG